MSSTVFALKSTFTPSASCLSTVYQYGPSAAFWQQLGPSTLQDCLPPNYSPSSDFFYSPGVCPSGYVQACSSSVVVGSLTETRATCCPSNYHCQTQSFFSWYSTLGCTLSSIETFLPYIISSTSTTISSFTGGINAYSVQIRWQSTDIPSTPTGTAVKTVTVTTAPSGASSNRGLTTGNKVGIGVGIPFAVIAIGLLVWIGLILRKRKAQIIEPTVESAIPHFQNKAELPSSPPARVGIVAEPHPVEELP